MPANGPISAPCTNVGALGAREADIASLQSIGSKELAGFVMAVCLLLGTAGSARAQSAGSGPAIVDASAQAAISPAPQGAVHIVPFGRGAGTIKNTAAPAGAHLTYWGGPIISHVHVIAVFWGPNVNPAVTAGIGAFYTDITNSTYFDLLSEYSTTGVLGGGTQAVSTNQTLVRGSFDIAITITPTVVCVVPCTLDDAQIQTELAAQITAGHLPQPVTDAGGNAESLYMIYFPPGISITQSTLKSCVNGGFCAYHSNTPAAASASLVPYGVLPDMFPPSGCATGCGANATSFQNVTAVSSHEMVEAVTDALVGSANTNDPPLGWYDPFPAPATALGEIGDICNGQDVPITVGAKTYAVQQQFSNIQNDCVSAPPKFAVTAPATGQVGSAFNLTLTVQSSVNAAALAGYTGKVHFTSTDAQAVLPADYTFVAGDAGAHTFPITLKSSGNQTITVSDVNATAFTGSASLNLVSPVPDLQPALVAASANLNQGQNNASYQVIVSNHGGLATSGTVTVANTLGAGLTATALGGTGWTCTVATATCTRADALAGNASYPTLTVTFNVASTAPASSSAGIAVSGGGDGILANNTSTFTASVAPALTMGVTGSNTATIAAGSPAAYTLALTMTPVAGTVTFACSGLPAASSCSFSPATLTASGSTALTISTTAHGTTIPVGRFHFPDSGAPVLMVFLVGLAVITTAALSDRRLRRRVAFAAIGLLALAALSGCGGGGGGPSIPPVIGTQAGTYTVTVTASGASSPAAQALTLIVR